MDISLDKSTGQYQIKSYTDGCIRVNDAEYRQPLTVTLENLSTQNLPNDINHITVETLQELDIDQYEAVLFGTGEKLEQPSWELIEAAQIMRAPLEVMSTPAACRTFTVLASEGRRVLAILYP